MRTGTFIMSQLSDSEGTSYSLSENEDSDQFSGSVGIERRSIWEKFISSFSNNITGNIEQRRQRSRGSSERRGSKSTTQRTTGVLTDETIISEPVTSNNKFNRKRAVSGSGYGHAMFSGRDGGEGSSKSCKEGEYSKASKQYKWREEEFDSSEEDSEKHAGSGSRQFLRSFGVDMDSKCVQSSNGETEIRRTKSNDSKKFESQKGIHESDFIVEDDFEINCQQTETERMRRFIMECIANKFITY